MTTYQPRLSPEQRYQKVMACPKRALKLPDCHETAIAVAGTSQLLRLSGLAAAASKHCCCLAAFQVISILAVSQFLVLQISRYLNLCYV